MGLGKGRMKLLEMVFWRTFTVIVSDFRTKKTAVVHTAVQNH